MFNRKKHTLHLSMFAFFLCSYSIISAQTIGMLAWLVPISFISIIQLIKDYHDIQRKDLLTACFLSLIVLANNTVLSIAVFPAYLSATTMLHSSYDIPFLFTDKTIAKAQLRKTLLCLIAGILLAVLNLLLSNSYLHPHWKLSYLFAALQAGIFEEVYFRLFLFAWAIRLYGKASLTSFARVLIFIILIFPHVFLHFPQTLDIISILMLSLLFALPFSIMMQKINLFSAIGAHTLVDLLRFIMLGM